MAPMQHNAVHVKASAASCIKGSLQGTKVVAVLEGYCSGGCVVSVTVRGRTYRGVVSARAPPAADLQLCLADQQAWASQQEERQQQQQLLHQQGEASASAQPCSGGHDFQQQQHGESSSPTKLLPTPPSQQQQHDGQPAMLMPDQALPWLPPASGLAHAAPTMQQQGMQPLTSATAPAAAPEGATALTPPPYSLPPAPQRAEAAARTARLASTAAAPDTMGPPPANAPPKPPRPVLDLSICSPKPRSSPKQPQCSPLPAPAPAAVAASSHTGSSASGSSGSSALACTTARAPKQAKLARDMSSARPKACKTAYNFFASDAWSHAKVLAAHADTKEISRVVGEMWKVRWAACSLSWSVLVAGSVVGCSGCVSAAIHVAA